MFVTAGYSISVVHIIGQFLKVNSTLLEAKTAAGPKRKIYNYVLCCYRIEQVLLARFSQYNVHGTSQKIDNVLHLP
jgi:hypothetical protein